MTTGLVWAIVLGLMATIALFTLIPLWIVARFPDRASDGALPGYMRRADATVLPIKRPGHGYATSSERTAA